jgi:transposase InsO family protein
MMHIHRLHQQLGHLNIGTMARMARAGHIAALPRISTAAVNQSQCSHCIMGKETRLPSPSTDIRAKSPLARIHCDIWGPAHQKSLEGNVYFLTIGDDFSCYCEITPLRNKSQAVDTLKAYIAQKVTQINRKVKEVRTDGGAEFRSNAAQQYYSNKGITLSTTPPDAHAQNGRVERPHLTILNTVRTLLSSFPNPIAYLALIFVPIAKFIGQPPEYRLFHPFGAPC